METYIEQLKPLLEKVALKLGEGGGYLWKITVKQMWLKGWLEIGGMAIVIILVVLLGEYLFIKKALKNEDGETRGTAFMLWLGLITGALLLGIYGILHLLNPEFYAFNYFVELIK